MRDTNHRLLSILQGAQVFFIGRLISQVLKFLFQVLLSRGLGVSLYGIYTFARTIIQFAQILARFGTGESLLRFIPLYEDNKSKRDNVVGLGFLTACIGSILVGTSLYLSAPWITSQTVSDPVFTTTLHIFALALPFITLINLINSVFRGLEELRYQVLISDIIYPSAQIIVVIISFYLGYSLQGVVTAIALASILVLAISTSLLYKKTDLHPNYTLNGHNIKQFYNYSLPLTLKDIGSLLYTRVDILMIGFFLTESVIGVYRAAILVATTIALPLFALNQLFPPIASELYENSQINELMTVYETVTRWSLTVALPGFLVIGIYSQEILHMFGDGFSEGSLIMVIYAVGQLSNSAVGPSGFVLVMTNNQYVSMVNQWILGIINIILNFILIQELGTIGAALATSLVLIFINTLRVFQTWYIEGLFPYSVSYWKPLFAGIASGLFMFVLQKLLNGYLSLIAGSLFGVVFFFTIIYLIGLEDRDKDMITDVLDNR